MPASGTLAEFERLRPWARGDEYRMVDWKASARARQPIVRQLRHATNQSVVFLLDLGRTMTAEWQGRSAVDAALDALLLTGHVALREAFAALRTHVRSRSLVVLFTSLADEGSARLLRQLLPTVSRHLVVWVALRNPGVEAMANRPPNDDPLSPWERGAAAEFLNWRQRTLDDARSRGVHVSDALPAEVTPTLLSHYLDVKARQVL